MAKTTVDTLAADIQKILNEYGEKVDKLTDDTVKKIARKGAQALKSKSGVYNGTKYKSGWTVTLEAQRTGSTAIIHNKTPGLPHLLEKSHALRNGGRSRPRVHIAPVEQEVIRAFESELEQTL